MRALEFESVTHNHSVPVPENIPDGTPVKVVVLTQAASTEDRQRTFKGLLCEVAQGLTDADLERSRETGRAIPEWPTS
ncbi:MAG: hypothetical protein M0Z85_06700 [Gammaproteobacteria bacterium]|nr:hypothetical protein [Gammaproteobacteria bacterium]